MLCVVRNTRSPAMATSLAKFGRLSCICHLCVIVPVMCTYLELNRVRLGFLLCSRFLVLILFLYVHPFCYVQHCSFSALSGLKLARYPAIIPLLTSPSTYIYTGSQTHNCFASFDFCWNNLPSVTNRKSLKGFSDSHTPNSSSHNG